MSVWASHEQMFTSQNKDTGTSLPFPALLVTDNYPCKTIITSRRTSTLCQTDVSAHESFLDKTIRMTSYTLLPKCNVSTNSKQKWKQNPKTVQYWLVNSFTIVLLCIGWRGKHFSAKVTASGIILAPEYTKPTNSTHLHTQYMAIY